MLEALAGIEPPFVLSGGAALAGVYLGHRQTRDLDLFWRDRDDVADIARTIERRLAASGLTVSRLQSSAMFVRLRVADGDFAVRVDLIAEPGGALEPAIPQRIGTVQVLVDSPHAILIEKLCALLSRSELRDLIDVEALVERGEDLESAIAAAPRRDSGFSPLTLAWLLRELDVRGLGSVLGMDAAVGERLDRFRHTLIERLVAPPPLLGE
ncbi:MAG TPA: nucleotidyl transferase AbiEii/AbiGii toxin family protein [Thermoanaerobaculia bacterium]